MGDDVRRISPGERMMVICLKILLMRHNSFDFMVVNDRLINMDVVILDGFGSVLAYVEPSKRICDNNFGSYFTSHS